MTTGVRQGKRSFSQKYVTDPLTGIGVVFMYGIFKIMPVDTASFLGAGLGSFLSFFMRQKGKVALYNIRKCFPENTDKEHRVILKKMWRHFGRLIGEYPHIDKMYDRLTFQHLDYMEQLRDDGKGGFVVTAHYGNWELNSLVTNKIHLPLHVVYRAANNPWTEKLIFSRRKSNATLIPKGPQGARDMIHLLRNGEHIGMLCDQKLNEGIEVPFFGYPAKTASAVAQLALKMDLPIIMGRVPRTKGAHYEVIFSEPLEKPNTGDKEKDILLLMTAINQTFEDWIRERPEQWLWFHRRWSKSEYK